MACPAEPVCLNERVDLRRLTSAARPRRAGAPRAQSPVAGAPAAPQAPLLISYGQIRQCSRASGP